MPCHWLWHSAVQTSSSDRLQHLTRDSPMVSLVTLAMTMSYYLQLQITQLDTLLSKASEYSNFISNDLEELQAAMAENARKKVERSEKRSSKKRKAEGKDSARKKSKRGATSDQALKSALVKDAKVRAGSKPIFVQPPNLSEDCTLKDYQLEGVRWMASLFENGVSGILADEVSSTDLLGSPSTLESSPSSFFCVPDGTRENDTSDWPYCPSIDAGSFGTVPCGCSTRYFAELGSGVPEVASVATCGKIPRKCS